MPMIAKLVRKHAYRLRSIWTMLAGFDKPLQTIAIFTGRAAPGNRMIRVRGTDLRFEIRGPMDAWCLKETLLDRVYERYGFPIEPDWTVLDIGAGFGDFTVLAARSAPRGHVYAFEPYPESFALLLGNIDRNRVRNAVISEIAVTGRPRSLALDTSSGDPLRFGIVEAPPEAAITSQTLAEIFERHGLDQIDLLKLDCEGAEYDILLNSPAEVIYRAERVVLEYHADPRHGSHLDLVDYLVGAGYRVETFPSPVHPTQLGYLRAIREGASE